MQSFLALAKIFASSRRVISPAQLRLILVRLAECKFRFSYENIWWEALAADEY
jgi:hypothetical protein